MSSALLVALLATLGTGLLGTSAACLVLWRRVHAPTSSRGGSPVSKVVVPVALNGPSTPAEAPRPIIGVRPLGPAFAGPSRDELTRRIDDLLDKHRALEDRVARVEASAADRAVSRVTVPSPLSPRAGRRVDPGGSATSAGPTLISVPDLAAPPGSNAEAAAELDRRFGPVWAMLDEGMAVAAIARETGYPIGQVELILGLRRRLLGAEAGPDA